MLTDTSLRTVVVFALFVASSGVVVPNATAQVDRVVDQDWTHPRTADGQPDLQGMWGNKTITPIERPDAVQGKAFLTREEIAEIEQQTAARRAQAEANPNPNAVGGYNNHWLDSGDTVLSTGQTSLIVDPPDGRAPVRPWALAAKAYNLAHLGDHYQHMSVWDRCLSRGVPGSMLPAGYNNAYRILQTPDHVIIQHEMIHDVRIIPLSDRPYIDPRITQWMGDARAHWDGETLVVDTKNFHNRGWIASSAAGARLKGIPTSTRLHVVERYRRVSDDTIVWTVTIDDPNVYSRPWTISMPLTQDPGYEIYEYACHEGNWAVRNALSGQRALDAGTESDQQ
jgi:hypothetical protein